jgi:integrative and conjugative element protein (TIGR02256 family)
MTPLRSVRLSRAAADRIIVESASRYPLETGGILLGRLDGDRAEVVDAGGPGPEAEHGPAWFVRDGLHAQAELDAQYAQSNGRHDYLGEWHSHPAPVGPSPRDRASLSWIARNRAYDCPHPLLVICQRGRSGGWRLLGYRWTGMLLKKVAVEVVDVAYDDRAGYHSS